MEFRDLKNQYKLHKESIDKAILEVIKETDFINGYKIRQLEEKLAAYVGVKHCITCANGTDALQLALMAWGIGKGDAVFVPDFTFFSSGEVVPLVGASPIFVDVDKDTFNVCIDSLNMAIEYVVNHTDLIPKVIVAVDLFGQPADFSAIRKIADKYNMYILEDGAQGFGGSISGKKACSFGHISTTSFFPAKPLGCYGDGGAIFTDDDRWDEKLRSLKVHGKGEDKYDNIYIGMNSRLDTVQAAVLLEKMEFFDEEIEKCNIIAKEYKNCLEGVVKVPVVRKGMQSSWAQYTICFDNMREREDAMKKMKDAGVPTAIYYKKPMHLQQAFAKWKMDMFDYSVTENLCKTCLSLPMHAYLEEEDIKTVCRNIFS